MSTGTSTVIVLAIVVVWLGVAVQLVVALRRGPARMLASRTRRTLLVHRTQGRPTIRGMLREEAPDGLVLAHAWLLLEPERRGDPTPDPVPLAGDVLIPWGTVDVVQDPRLAEQSAHTGPGWVKPVAAPSQRSAWDAAPPDPRPLRQVE